MRAEISEDFSDDLCGLETPARDVDGFAHTKVSLRRSHDVTDDADGTLRKLDLCGPTDDALGTVVPDYGRMRPLLEIEERDGLVSFHVGGKAVRGAEV